LIQRVWRFVTGATVPVYATTTLALDIRIAARARGSASAPKLAISARGAALGRRVTLRVRNLRRVCRPRCSTRRVGPTTTARLRLAGLRRVSLPRLTRGDTGWSVSVTAQGFSRDGVRYRAYNVTRTIRPR
jgi:hypothetical protein